MSLNITLEDIKDSIGRGATVSFKLDRYFARPDFRLAETARQAESFVAARIKNVPNEEDEIRYPIFRYAVVSETARRIVLAILLGDTGGAAATVEGLVRIDNTEQTRRLSSVEQRLAREREDQINILTAPAKPPIAHVRAKYRG